MKHMHRWIIALAALLAVFPLLVHGPSCGHDFNFHLDNWMEAQRQWSHGVLLPRWSFRAAWGAGEPRFIFYPPASWMLGALLGVVTPWTFSTTAYTFVVLLLSGVTMHRFAREYVSAHAATAVACLYLANPYMLFTAYERTAYAELLAAAWMPLLLQEALRTRIRVARLAVPVALLWLTNAPAAVVGCYSLAVIAAVRVLLLLREGRRTEAWPLLRGGVLGVGLGIALASIYLVPVLVQRGLVQVTMTMVDGMRPWQNFLFTHRGEPAHDAVLHSVSVATALLLAVALLSGIALLITKRSSAVVSSLLTLTLVIAFLQTPLSTFVWMHAPQLGFLQFAWRFAALESAVAAMLLALVLQRIATQRMFLAGATVLVVAASVFAASWNYRQYCDEEDNPAAQRASFLRYDGNWPTDEYTPAEADNDALARDLPAFWTAKTPGSTPDHPASTGVTEVTEPNPYHLRFYTQENSLPFLVMRVRAFRGWHLLVDGKEAPLADRRDDGLTSVAVPQGRPGEIELVYRWTWDEYLGVVMTLLAGVFLLAMPWRVNEAVK